jgi:hypothetical protein
MSALLALSNEKLRYLVRFAAQKYLPVAEGRRDIRNPGYFPAVGDEQYGAAVFVDTADDVSDLLYGDSVDTRIRFVQYRKLRSHYHDGGELYPFSLSAR